VQNLRELISLSGKKQATVARELNVSQPVISYWINDKQLPTVENAISCANLFGVSVGCVLDQEPIPEGYGEAWTQPVFYSEVIENQKKAEQEGRLAKKPEKPPFSKAQMEFLKSRDDELVEKVVSALREDSSSLKEPEAR